MCLGCASLGPTSSGLSELPGLWRSLFPLPDWGSSPSLYFQISFPFLALPLLLLAPYDLDVGTFKVVPEVPKPLLVFLSSCFFILHLLDVYFSLLFQIVDLNPVSFPSLLVFCIFFFISLFIAFTSSSILRPYSFLWAFWLLVFWTLHLIGWLSPRCLVLFLEFWSVLSFRPYFFVPSGAPVML